MSVGSTPEGVTRASGGFDPLVELDALLEMPLDARSRRLGEIREADPIACRVLERWLAADAAPALPTLDPARYAALLDEPEEPETEASTLVGPWRLLRELGRGGMGSVWLAERADGQYEQQAALKLIKRGMDSEAIQARFLSERRILATLEHPNIARLLDGGVAADGRPYFAMEYVSGTPLPEFARQGQLDLRQRLALFLKLCNAVAYAHSRLVVHRDLKPSNVLVSADGEPKLLDFGIAKLLDDSAAGTTRTGERVFTPAYAAPEQLAGEPASTATDVFALGLLLFELLSGEPPPSAAHLRPRTTERPSQARSRMGDAGPASISTAQLRGDLDLIVVKSMAEDPVRRYATAQALADDLARFLDGRPIQARPDSVGYRMRKFTRRHATSVAAAALVVLALAGGLAAALWQAQRATQAGARAETVKNFLADMFRASDPAQARGKALSARDLLDQGAQRLDKELNASPDVKAELQALIGGVYLKLGDYKEAEPVLVQAERSAAAAFGEQSREHGNALTALARLSRAKGQYPQAVAHASEAERILRAGGPAAAADLSATLVVRADLYAETGDHESEERLAREALALARAGAGEQSDVYRTALGALALAYHWRDNYPAAEPIYRERVDNARKGLGDDHPLTISALAALGALQVDMCHYADAEASLRASIAGAERVYGSEHKTVQATRVELAYARMMQGHAAEAEATLRAAREAIKTAQGAGHPRVGYASIYLGYALTAQGHLAEAAAAQREAAAIYAAAAGKGADYSLRAKGGLAVVLREQGHPAESLALLREILPPSEKIEGDGGTHVALIRVLMANDLALLGDAEAAQALVEPARRTLLARLGKDIDFVALDAQEALAQIALARGDRAKAAELYAALLAHARSHFGADDFRTGQYGWQLAQVTDDTATRTALEREATRVLAADAAADHPLAVRARGG